MRLPWLRSAAPLPPTHEDLVRRVALGDEAAFEDLYDAVSPQVFGLIRRVVRDPAQSEEVTQEVFVEVWQQAARFDADRGRAVSWILVIAHRRAVDRIRASQASADRDLRQGIKEFQESYDDVQDIVEAKLEGERVLKALESLTQAQQEAIRLAYYGGYTQQEVANLLKVPVGTVKTRIRDGMIRLRDKLGVA
ncbi:RNA polymerase sigma factor SigK [Arthrobacter crystallopoietes BAB-32]|uniref:RNA polymerase sigma factor n=1 Tax=Arthrobacter crystallopoietes BAB-32 TaxID=1246476 RepID=N1USN7_9MICC|nr:ECF RNA polymerase sigma factor SigK [Arthrobacter crystallopoietes]EMY33431.1 RNA polymerase sigma factor SigK [Arthrobacter crystallopoietes BAB-32]